MPTTLNVTRPPSSASAQTEYSKNSGRSELQLGCRRR